MATPKTTIDRIAVLTATAFGAGFAPKAPGTAGSAVGVGIFLLMHQLHLGAYFLHAIILLFIAGTLAAHRVEAFWGHDSQRIVIDEVIGQMIAYSGVAASAQFPGLSVIVGFVLFRFFDITKPFPIRRLERLPGGVGVIADDVGAGVYALAVLTLIQSAFGV